MVICYRPPQGDIEECLRLLEERLLEFDLAQVDVYIIRDLNMNIFDKEEKKNQNFNSSLKQLGLIQQINNPTRITSKTATCMDLCYTNFNIIAKASVCDVSLRIDYCGFGLFYSTHTKLLLSILPLKVLICIIYQ